MNSVSQGLSTRQTLPIKAQTSEIATQPTIHTDATMMLRIGACTPNSPAAIMTTKYAAASVRETPAHIVRIRRDLGVRKSGTPARRCGVATVRRNIAASTNDSSTVAPAPNT